MSFPQICNSYIMLTSYVCCKLNSIELNWIYVIDEYEDSDNEERNDVTDKEDNKRRVRRHYPFCHWLSLLVFYSFFILNHTVKFVKPMWEMLDFSSAESLIGF